MEEDLVTRQNIPFKGIPAAGVHGVGFRTLPRNLWRLACGTFAARKIIRDFHPDVILFTGGYVAAPIAVASGSVPKLLYVPDIEPGMALKFLSHFADRIAVTIEESRIYFKSSKPVVVTGYPTRPDLAHWTAEDGRNQFGLTVDKPVLLVLGGSKGARSINQALQAILPRLLEITQVIHLTGMTNWTEIEKTKSHLPTGLQPDYHPFPYLHEEMGAALACANLVVARAGASALGEFPLFGLPAVLVPYPHAWRYQKVNADYLVRAGAAEMVPDAEMNTQLLPTLQRLLKDKDALSSMRQAMQIIATPDASLAIAKQLHDLVLPSASEGNRRENKPC